MSQFRPNKTMLDVLICERCKDMGYLIGTARSETNPALNRSWTEVCPICMPTNKYGNLLQKIPRFKLLDHKKDSDDKEEK